jgi:hypothetical protein
MLYQLYKQYGITGLGWSYTYVYLSFQKMYKIHLHLPAVHVQCKDIIYHPIDIKIFSFILITSTFLEV